MAKKAEAESRKSAVNLLSVLDFAECLALRTDSDTNLAALCFFASEDADLISGSGGYPADA